MKCAYGRKTGVHFNVNLRIYQFVRECSIRLNPTPAFGSCTQFSVSVDLRWNKSSCVEELLHNYGKCLSSAGFQAICLLWVIFEFVILRLQTAVIINV